MGYAVGAQCTVCMQYAVGDGAKRSTHTVDLANIGGGDHYLWCKNVKPTQWGMQYAVGVSAKRSTHTVGYAVGAKYAVGMQ